MMVDNEKHVVALSTYESKYIAGCLAACQTI